jgi:hypothetical protein
MELETTRPYLRLRQIAVIEELEVFANFGVEVYCAVSG